MALTSEHKEFFDSFLETLKTTAEAAKDVQILWPVVSRLFITKYIADLGTKGLQPEEFKAKKEMAYMLHRTLLGAWIVANTTSMAGEGAGLALMAVAPWSNSIVEAAKDFPAMVKQNYEDDVDSTIEAWEQFKLLRDVVNKVTYEQAFGKK